MRAKAKPHAAGGNVYDDVTTSSWPLESEGRAPGSLKNQQDMLTFSLCPPPLPLQQTSRGFRFSPDNGALREGCRDLFVMQHSRVMVLRKPLN